MNTNVNSFLDDIEKLRQLCPNFARKRVSLPSVLHCGIQNEGATVPRREKQLPLDNGLKEIAIKSP